jgi:pimeloyl-ACP methyl ester carboxylesterase
MAPLEVILVPGMDGTGKLFRPLLQALPASLLPRVVPYPAGATTFADVESAIVAAFPPSGPFAILAESFSGPAALAAASRMPAGLVAVVLAASFVRSPCPGPVSRLRGLARGPLVRLGAHSALLRRILHAGAPEEIAAEALAVIRSVDARLLAARARQALSADSRDILRACPVPILLLRASRDRLVPARTAREMKAIRPDLEEVVLDAPHLVLQSRPADAARAIEEFVLRSAAGQGAAAAG